MQYYSPDSLHNRTAPQLYSIPNKYTENQYIANADYIVSPKHSLQMRYMYSNNPFEYQLSGTFGQLPGRVQSDKRSSTSSVLRLTTIVNPSVVNQARLSFRRIIQNGSAALAYSHQPVGIIYLI